MNYTFTLGGISFATVPLKVCYFVFSLFFTINDFSILLSTLKLYFKIIKIQMKICSKNILLRTKLRKGDVLKQNDLITVIATHFQFDNLN